MKHQKNKFKLIHLDNEKNLYRLINPKYKDWQFVGIKNAVKKNKWNVPDLFFAFKVEKGIAVSSNFRNKKIFVESLKYLEDLLKNERELNELLKTK